MVDKYDRVRVLGSGTYGRAWLVKERKTNQLFVMKEIKVQNKRELEEAKTEAELLSKFSHPNIIKYQEIIQTGSKVVNIVMEYAAGGDLQARLNRRKIARSPFSQEEILRWLAQLCEALLLVHQQGMMHRDIKLANLFLTEDDCIKLGDFGIARVLDQNAANISARTCRTPVGTPMYMAPELCQGKPYGQKADLWATGCALYELMTFTPAFNAQSLEGLMHRIKRGRYDQNFPPIYSRDLQELVHSLLNVNSSARPGIRQIMALPLLAPYLSKTPQGKVDIPAELAMRKKLSAHLERVVEESDQASSGGAAAADLQSSGEDRPAGKGAARGSELKPLKRLPGGRPSMEPSSSDGEATPVRGAVPDDRGRRALFDDRERERGGAGGAGGVGGRKPAGAGMALPPPQQPSGLSPVSYQPLAPPALAGVAPHMQEQYRQFQEFQQHLQPQYHTPGARGQAEQHYLEPPWSFGEPTPSHGAVDRLQDPWFRSPMQQQALPGLDPRRQPSRDMLVAAHAGAPSVLVVEHDPLNNSLHVARRKAAKREMPSMMDLVNRYQSRHASDVRRRPVAVGPGHRPF